MEIHLLAIQARVLLWMAVAITAAGLWLGFTPWTIAWRAAIGAVVAMVAARWLLGQIARVIEERMAQDVIERQFAAERALAEAAEPAKPQPKAAKPQPRPAVAPRPAAGR